MTRYAIIAATVSGNRGAEAMLETTIGRLRDATEGACEFVVYSYYPDADRALVSDPTVTVRSSTPAHLVLVLFPFSLLLAPFAAIGLRGLAAIFPASVRDLARCDALVDLAGVSFIDGREKFLPFNVLTILPAMLLGVPVFKLSQAMGPFGSFVNRLSARLLRRCRLVVARGAKTAENLETLALPAERVMRAADVAFVYEERDSLSDEGAVEAAALLARIEAARGAEATDAPSAVVGVCPSSVIASRARSEGWDYSAFLAQCVRGLLDDGHQVVLFPNATRAAAGDALRNNDLPVIARVSQLLADAPGAAERLHSVTGDMSARSIRLLVERCDCAIVSRFHAMVGALATGVPVLVVGWSHKYAEVMDQFGLGELSFDYSDHDPEAFTARARDLVRERAALAERVREHLPAVLESSAAQFVAVARDVAGEPRA